MLKKAKTRFILLKIINGNSQIRFGREWGHHKGAKFSLNKSPETKTPKQGFQKGGKKEKKDEKNFKNGPFLLTPQLLSGRRQNHQFLKERLK